MRARSLTTDRRRLPLPRAPASARAARPSHPGSGSQSSSVNAINSPRRVRPPRCAPRTGRAAAWSSTTAASTRQAARAAASSAAPQRRQLRRPAPDVATTTEQLIAAHRPRGPARPEDPRLGAPVPSRSRRPRRARSPSSPTASGGSARSGPPARRRSRSARRARSSGITGDPSRVDGRRRARPGAAAIRREDATRAEALGEPVRRSVTLRCALRAAGSTSRRAPPSCRLVKKQVGHSHAIRRGRHGGARAVLCAHRVLAGQRVGLPALGTQERPVVQREVRPAQAGARVRVHDLRPDGVPRALGERVDERARPAGLRVAVRLPHDGNRCARREQSRGAGLVQGVRIGVDDVHAPEATRARARGSRPRSKRGPRGRARCCPRSSCASRQSATRATWRQPPQGIT